jgi:hypothetical protein
MQKDRPFLSREIKGALEFLDVGHHAEAPLRIGVVERISDRRGRLNDARLATRSKFQEGFGCFTGQAIRQQQEAVFGGLPSARKGPLPTDW